MGRRSNGFAWKRRTATAQNIQAGKEVGTIRIDIVKADDIAVMEPDKQIDREFL